MKGKKLIAIVLMLVFSIPLAPISQVGSLLSSNQLQEEVIHAYSAKDIYKTESELTLHPPLSLTLHPESLLLSKQSLYSRQADDVNTPPPNV